MKRILFALIWCIYSIEILAVPDPCDHHPKRQKVEPFVPEEHVVARDPCRHYSKRRKVEVSPKKEHVVVVGGGYAGVISSLLLSRVQTKDKMRMYKVFLVEKDPYILQGTSLAVGRLHLGGEYPRDETTATQCMDGAILFRQMFPPEVFSEYQRMAFMVSEKNDSELTPKELEERYAILKNKYVEHYNKLVKEYGDKSSTMFFGTSDGFYRSLRKEECPDGFAGGVLTQEKTWNVGLMGAAIERLLLAEGVDILWGEHLNRESIEKKADNTYKIHLQKWDPLDAHQIVNATGADIFSLYPKPAKIGENSGYNYYQRLIVAVDISRCKLPKFTTKGGESIEAGIFGLLGESGGMFNPVTQNLALLFVPGEDYSYIHNSTVAHLYSGTPQDIETTWEDLRKRAEKIIESIKEKYGKDKRVANLDNMTFVQAFMRPTLSRDQKLSERRYIPVTSYNGYHNIVLTKATTAPLSALELVNKVLEHSKEAKPRFTEDMDEATLRWLEAFDPQELTDPVLPPDFRFMVEKDKDFKHEVTIFLQQRKMSLGYNPDISARDLGLSMEEFLSQGIEEYNMFGNMDPRLQYALVPTHIDPGMWCNYFKAVTDVTYRSIVAPDQLEKDMGRAIQLGSYFERINQFSPWLVCVSTNTARALSECGEYYAALRALDLAESNLRFWKQNGMKFPKEIEIIIYANRFKRALLLEDEAERAKSKQKLRSLRKGDEYSYDFQVDQLEIVRQDGKLENSELAPRSYKEYDFKYLVEKLSKISPEEMKKIERQAFKIITEDMDSFDRGHIIVALNNVPREDREDVANRASMLVEGTDGWQDRTKIIKAIAKVPKGAREEFVNQASKLVEDVENRHTRAYIIKAIAKFSKGEREDVANQAVKLVEGFEKSYNQSCIIRAIAKVPKGEREDVANQASRLVEGVEEPYEWVYIIKAIAKVPKGEREEVISQATKLFEDVEFGHIRAKIIKAIAKVPKGEREEFVNQAAKLVVGVGERWVQKPISKSIAKVPEEEREEFVNQAAKVVGGVFVEWDGRIHIIKAIAQIPEREREGVATQAAKFVEDIESSRLRSKIITLISQVSPKHREDLANQVLRLVEGVANELGREFIIDTLAQSPEEQIGDVTSNASKIFEGEATAWQRTQIIRAISKTPKEDREDLVTQILKLVGGVEKGYDRAKIIESMTKIPEGEREGVVNIILNEVKGIEDREERSQRIIEEIRTGLQRFKKKSLIKYKCN